MHHYMTTMKALLRYYESTQSGKIKSDQGKIREISGNLICKMLWPPWDSNDEFNSHSEDAQDLVPDNTDPVLESQSESLRRTWYLLTLSKKFLNFFRPTCFLEN